MESKFTFTDNVFAVRRFGPVQGLENFKWPFAMKGHCCTMTEGMESCPSSRMDTEYLISESVFFIMVITLS
jgi:hypothetical protein